MILTDHRGDEAVCAAHSFDAALERRAPLLRSRPETQADRDFLIALFVACSPMAEILPPPMVRQQAHAQDAGHRAQHPLALRRVVESAGCSIGRIVIDWRIAGQSHVVDIAVHPDARAMGVGSHMLNAWLEVADGLGLQCRLQVLRDNPAMRLYARLGFTPTAPLDPDVPVLVLARAIPRSGGS